MSLLDKKIPQAINFSDFIQKVKNRILLQFLEKTRTPKLESHLWMFPFYCLIAPIVVPGIFWVLGLFNEPSTLGSRLIILFSSIFLGSIWVLSFAFSLAHTKGYFNYQKYSDKFYGTLTSKLPILEDSEVSAYLDKSDPFCSQLLSAEDTNQLKYKLLKLTQEEINELSEISLLESQKKHLSICLFNQQPLMFDDLLKMDKMSIQQVQKNEYINTHSKLIAKINPETMKKNEYLLKDLL